MFVINFDGSKEHRAHFEICYQAIIATDKEATRDNEDDFIALLQKMKRVSTEAAEKLGGIKLRDLQEGGASLALDRSEHKLLVACIERPIWRPVILEQKRDALKFVKEAKEVAVTPALVDTTKKA